MACRWAGLQIDGESSVLDEAVMGPAAGLVQCRVCHALAVHAWDLAMAWVHMGRLDSLPLPLMRHLKLFADSEVQPYPFTHSLQHLSSTTGCVFHDPTGGLHTCHQVPSERALHAACSAFD